MGLGSGIGMVNPVDYIEFQQRRMGALIHSYSNGNDLVFCSDVELFAMYRPNLSSDEPKKGIRRNMMVW